MINRRGRGIRLRDSSTQLSIIWCSIRSDGERLLDEKYETLGGNNMRINSKGIRILLGMFFFVCLVAGAVASQNTFTQSANNQNSTNPHYYPKNINGQTYGSGENANHVDVLPDLIHVGSVNGIAGYVMNKDYLSEFSREVPLYDVDGKTIIGSYPIGAKKMKYPQNKNGQTHGSSADASSPEMKPELINAIGVDGTQGYVLKKDIDGVQPKSPEEAIAIQNSRSPGGRDIPLYEVDGETVIGVFHIG